MIARTHRSLLGYSLSARSHPDAYDKGVSNDSDDRDQTIDKANQTRTHTDNTCEDVRTHRTSRLASSPKFVGMGAPILTGLGKSKRDKQ